MKFISKMQSQIKPILLCIYFNFKKFYCKSIAMKSYNTLTYFGSYRNKLKLVKNELNK